MQKIKILERYSSVEEMMNSPEAKKIFESYISSAARQEKILLEKMGFQFGFKVAADANLNFGKDFKIYYLLTVPEEGLSLLHELTPSSSLNSFSFQQANIEDHYLILSGHYFDRAKSTRRFLAKNKIIVTTAF